MRSEEKLKNRCKICGFLKHLCICKVIEPVYTQTRVCVIMHVRELWWSKRVSNTGKLADIGLSNSETKYWGMKDKPFNPNYFNDGAYTNLFLFPSENSVTLTPELISKEDEKIRLVVPDGNWRQAGNMSNRIKKYDGIKCVKLPDGGDSIYKLRTNPNQDRISTFEAILRALSIVEKNFNREPLDRLFDVMIKRALMNRGKIKPDESFL